MNLSPAEQSARDTHRACQGGRARYDAPGDANCPCQCRFDGTHPIALLFRLTVPDGDVC